MCECCKLKRRGVTSDVVSQVLTLELSQNDPHRITMHPEKGLDQGALGGHHLSQERKYP